MCKCIVECLIHAIVLNTLFLYAAMLYSPDVSDPAVSEYRSRHSHFEQLTEQTLLISYGRKACTK